MSNSKIKILFIPADNIEANISRSYYFAKGLTKYSELYFVTWKDYRSVQWLGGKLSKVNTLKCFFQSYFSKYKLFNNKEDNFTRVNCSVFVDAIVGKLLGRVYTKKIMRKHNAKTLKKLISEIKPDVIFYSDAGYFFPALKNTKILQICDIQDDTNWTQFSPSLQDYEKAYKKKQYQKFDIHYIVSQNAKKNVSNNIGEFPFKVVYNGADFTEIQKDYTDEIKAIKDQFKLHNKYIITHVGSATWVDPKFTKKLFSELYKVDSSIILLLVGSMAKIDLPNVINVGMVPAAESYIYYNLTDLALLLKNSKGSNFLYNSVPLKNIQYGAASKPVISFPIEWLETEKFTNTFIIESDTTEDWIKKINEVRNSFKWNKSDTNQWKNYDWNLICENIFAEITAELTISKF